MPRTPDRKPGPLQEYQEFQLKTPAGSVPSLDGGIVYDPTLGSFQFQDATGVFDPRTGGGGLTPASHKVLDQLVHNIAETSYLEITRTNGQVTDVVYWTDASKTTKVRETNITRASGLVSQVVIKQYDGTGTLAETLTGSITRANGQISSIGWTLT
jgi:hypothetical protein